jgi:hypothetical protein
VGDCGIHRNKLLAYDAMHRDGDNSPCRIVHVPSSGESWCEAPCTWLAPHHFDELVFAGDLLGIRVRNYAGELVCG